MLVGASACRAAMPKQLSRAWQAAEEAVEVEVEVGDALRVASMVAAFRSCGHRAAQLDPLKRVQHGPWLCEGTQACTAPGAEQELVSLLRDYNAAKAPQDATAAAARRLGLRGRTTPQRQFFLGDALLASNPGDQKWWTLPEVIARMRGAYCGTLTAQIDHLPTRFQQEWLVRHLEQPVPLLPAQQRGILRALVQAESFEGFLAQKFPASKRFGVEGCEALLPGLEALVARCAEHGVKRMEVGMSHRGRLNVLCNVLHKPAGALYSEMEGEQSEFHVGDVKYHLGQVASRQFTGQDGQQHNIRLSIAPNPSHLEAVNAVVLGLVRAEQGRRERGAARVLGLLIHGDAAFAGLGAVPECLQLANVPGFTTGGTIHLVVNNQVGFTTTPGDGRSSVHATDVAKAVGAPVLHANADDPEAVVRACSIAADWRAEFGRDVVVDLVGYRRHGHNELDDPQATLPLSYAAIAQHPSVVLLYTRRLEAQGVLAPEEVAAWQQHLRQEYEREFEASVNGTYRVSAGDWLGSTWQGDALQALGEVNGDSDPVEEPTGLPLPTLQWVGQSICRRTEDFNLHPEVRSMLDRRREMVRESGSRVDWAMGEALAFGTLALHQGARPPGVPVPHAAAAHPTAGLNRGHYGIRLTGQDVERGTFNQRHAVVYDQLTARRRVALNAIQPGQQEALEVWNSPLSEAAVLGYEYGFSLASRGRALTLWEAQFGDFANNAQVVIDQFIAAGEERWGQQSGLVLLLPHGFDGQGPDHSSARMERFLSLVNDDADHLPGYSPAHKREINATFEAISRDYGGRLTKEQAVEVLRWAGLPPASTADISETLWADLGLLGDAHITKEVWEALMVKYMRRNAEKQAALFVVAPSTPAQLFHVLRRQMNRAFHKPLIVFTPKHLLHHRPCTSALEDFTSGKAFNRVIDDGKSSDNTRHLAHNPVTGEAHLRPADRIRRVILCTGQIYYRLSQARRARKIRDIVLVRLEQIAPFAHDRVTAVVAAYSNAEVVWVQEEPKNMGAWLYVRSRLDTAMRELFADHGHQGRFVRYVGRPAAASPATASQAIHRAEMRELVDAALSADQLP